MFLRCLAYVHFAVMMGAIVALIVLNVKLHNLNVKMKQNHEASMALMSKL